MNSKRGGKSAAGMKTRACGVLMPLSSLPGRTGIGTLGRSAYEFVDFLQSAGQTYWQILPICPTSYGDSPYQSFSTFAGNPYFIDLDLLCEKGWLDRADVDGVDWGQDETSIDYGLLYLRRHEVLRRAMKRFFDSPPDDYRDFCEKNSFWLEDYALFMAVKDEHGGQEYQKWEDDIRTRAPGVCDMWRVKCSHSVQYYKMLQYLFFSQWFALKKYANDRGIGIIGDLPIYVAADSADVWADPRQFALDDDLMPTEVAGCPPDAFSEDGQLWGNPVYNWSYMKRTRYRWWTERLRASLEIYDVIRIDHFRGFDSYYCIPADADSAKNGVWRKGPGMSLWNRMRKVFGSLPIIAEDLGFLTDSVRKLLADSGFPGMKVMQFAFDSREESDYLPHRYSSNCVVYTGTHDNDTVLGWCGTAAPADVDFAKKYLRADSADALREHMMLAAMMSVADTCILTMQDLIGLGSAARMNTPSTVGENWKWRATADQITPKTAAWLRENTTVYGRLNRKRKGEFNERTEQSEKSEPTDQQEPPEKEHGAVCKGGVS